MALKVENFTTKNNPTVLHNSYHMISKISIGSEFIDNFEETDDSVILSVKKEAKIIAVVAVYVDEESRQKNVPPVDFYIVDLDLSNIKNFDDIYKNAYSQVKEFLLETVESENISNV